MGRRGAFAGDLSLTILFDFAVRFCKDVFEGMPKTKGIGVLGFASLLGLPNSKE